MGNPTPRLLALEAALVVLAALTQSVWFAGWPAGLPAAAPFALFAIVAALRFGVLDHSAARAVLARRPSTETIACASVALAFRLPALLHPWGWVNKDGAYGAFVALRILDGTRPVSPFTEGANYQGTLKSHIAAMLSTLTGINDLSFLLTASSVLLHLIFMVATMALARRIAGRTAALVAGLYLALSPRFVTAFTLNCVGQYADVLALGGAALALLARVMGEARHGATARGLYLGIGILLGAAFWQQPVAISYVVTAFVLLAARRLTWRDPWVALVAVGGALGSLPVLLWNLQNHWGTGAIVGREPGEVLAQLEALPRLAERTFTISLPIIAGVSPELPWAKVPAIHLWAVSLIPLALGLYVLRHRRDLLPALRGEVKVAWIPPLLLAVCVAIFLSLASGRVHFRPRYLLPVAAATAVHVGAVVAWTAARRRLLACVVTVGLLLLNVAGSWPRLAESGPLADHFRHLVRSLEEKQIRTGYAPFAISAPVTMFTAERIVLSSRLDPLPAYEPARHRRLLDTAGPDAYVLSPEDEWQAFAERLQSLGVTYTLDLDPVPVFYHLSRRVALEEVMDFRRGPVPGQAE